MISINVNNIKYKVPKFLTIFQACDFLGIKIPHFCYHDKLSIAGNCRMCLIEENKSLKPLASCAVNINSSLKIFTDTILVKKSREGVLEFLLANHPLDCPICDQGGECDLQDQSIIFGGDRGRFYEIKRSVEDKNCGPLIKTIMTRCIHCTRCVRFSQEIGGSTNFGVTGRGNSMEIGFYIESFLNSELSGNIIDLCPVGALTSKPYAFVARSWELRYHESIDILDSLGSNIRIDTRGSDIMRIIPRSNDKINEEWISDKIRFMYDGLNKQRLLKPLLKIVNIYISVSWFKVFYIIKNFFYKTLKFLINKKQKFFFLHSFIGDFNDFLSLAIFKDFLTTFGSSSLESFQDLSLYNNSLPLYYSLNTPLNNLFKSDLYFFIGANPRMESPLLNSRFRKSKLLNNTSFYSFGFNLSSNFYIKSLGNNLSTLLKILEGRHWLCNKLILSKFPYFLIGNSFFQRNQISSDLFSSFTSKISLINNNWNGLNILHNNSSKLNSLDLGFGKSIHGQFNSRNLNSLTSSIYYFYNSDDLFSNINFSKKDLVIFQSSHGSSNLVNFADILLPQSNFIEKNSLYFNNTGSLQKTKLIFKSSSLVKDDWKIIKAFADLFKLDLKSYNSVSSINARLNNVTPYLKYKRINSIFNYNNFFLNIINIFNIPILSSLNNFYLNDVMSRSSKIMSLCSNHFYNKFNNF